MQIEKVIDISEPAKRKVELCTTCGGKGWILSELEFGDLPGDECKRKCSMCNGTGRTTTLHVAALVKVPYNYSI